MTCTSNRRQRGMCDKSDCLCRAEGCSRKFQVCRELDSNALVLPAEASAKASIAAAVATGPKLSKSQLKKQKKVQEELEKREQRSQVLQTYQLPPADTACISVRHRPASCWQHQDLQLLESDHGASISLTDLRVRTAIR